MSQHKHAFVGMDQQGDHCIYVLHIDQDGGTGKHFSAELLQVIADRINNSRIGLDKPGAALGALRQKRSGWPKGKPRLRCYACNRQIRDDQQYEVRGEKRIHVACIATEPK